MSYNWNVYKVFKNGNRAKAPMVTFECDEVTMEEYFNNVIKKNFRGKFANANYHIIRSDLPQEENLISEEENFLKEKNRVLGRLVAEKNIKHKYRLGGGLVYCKESDWAWQWAVLESGTGNYVAGLSPKFKDYGKAHNWMNQLIQTN